jgi:crotonobetainyl-CoA:carnitine CoA-transferase CaiB-like acyl-CoA transferase
MVGDIGGGALYLVAGMLAGLIRAGRTGQGTVVDAAIVDGSAHMMNLLMSLGAAGGLSMTRGQSLLDGPHWSRCYACADGRFISVQCLEARFYALFLEKLGLADDPEFARQYDPAAWPDLTSRLTELFARQPQAHWVALFDGSDACVAPVNPPDAAARDAHIAARGIWQTADGELQAAAAPRFDGQPPAAPRRAPTRGQDTDAILAELGRD